MKPYSPAFFGAVADGSIRSAAVIAPFVMESIRPCSALDVGCGRGWWLKALLDLGVNEVLGIDGDYVDRSDLVIPEDRFLPRDLRSRIRLSRTFDLVMSLEVAEHLPPECAEQFVKSLVAHGSCILFSAAIPGQGGVRHLNEQWPSFWARLFAQHGFLPIEFLRRQCWNHADVEYWYAQNLLVYLREGAEPRYPGLAEFPRSASLDALDVVHPRQYLRTRRELQEASAALWEARWELVGVDLARWIPATEPVALAARGWLPPQPGRKGQVVLLGEGTGAFCGTPANGSMVIDALSRWRRKGGNYFGRTWDVSWWDASFESLGDYLCSEADCLLTNDRCRIYRFR